MSRSELDPVKFLDRSAAIHPERVAVVEGERRYTYAELHERVNRLAWALHDRGLERHDRVAACVSSTTSVRPGGEAVGARGHNDDQAPSPPTGTAGFLWATG